MICSSVLLQQIAFDKSGDVSDENGRVPAMSVPFLPYGRQSVNESDIEAVIQVLKSTI